MTTLSTKPATLNARHTTGPRATASTNYEACRHPLPGPGCSYHITSSPGTYTFGDDGYSLSWHAPGTLPHIGLDLRPAMIAPWLLGCPGTA